MSTEKISTSGQKVTRKNPQKGEVKMKGWGLCDECTKKIKEQEGGEIIVIGKDGTFMAG